MQLQFDCVFYYVTDLAASVVFYRDVLGFKLHSQDDVARFDIDGHRLELVPVSPSQMAGCGNARLCLKTDNVTGALENLKKSGVRVGRVQDKRGGRLGSFLDLDGNEICLWQDT